MAIREENSLNQARVPRSAVRWSVLGLLLSSAVVIVISYLSGVSLSDFGALGYWPFGLAVVASAAGLLIDVLRFRILAAGLTKGSKVDLAGSVQVRLASEFLALATPSRTGGFFLSVAWLSKKGVNGGRALWIGYFEQLIQIYVGSAFGLVAAVYAFSRGGVIIGSVITLVVLCMVLGYTMVFLIPGLRGVGVPPRIFRIAARLIGSARARRFEDVVQLGAQNFSSAARAMLNKDSIPLIIKAVGLTILETVLSGLALWLMIASAGLRIDVFSSTIAVCGVIAICGVPMSIGGSGVAEVAMKSYLAAVYGFSSWAAIVLWRIASYQILLAISGIAFVMIMRGAAKYLSGNRPEAAIALAELSRVS